MFRRRTPEETPEPVTTTKVGGKGRPTPTRKEAEQARKERVRPQLNRREANRRQRELSRQQRSRAVEAMRTGDERYYFERDKGPVRRFVRDFVDSRRTVVEFFLPLLVVILVMSLLPKFALFANAMWLAVMLMVIIETSWLSFRLRKQLRERFPDDTGRGHVFYGIARASQIRRLRMPKPRVKPGAHV